MPQTFSAKVRPVILCGGSGTRLWPASRETFPKQFAPIIGARSTFQETLLRVRDESLFGKPLVVTNHAHRCLAEQQMHALGIEADILLEPMARDSGPAIIAANLFVDANSPGELALILAADHLVTDVPAFHAVVRAGLAAALAGRIVTFGIVPTHPATGYGYIAPGEAVEGGARAAARFVEKPDAPTARNYITKGYLWNSGNFLFAPRTVIAEYTAHDAESVANVRAALACGVKDKGVLALGCDAFEAAKKISFDFAVMEKTRKAAVVPGSFGWSDIGGWDALWDLADKNEQGNAVRGEALFIDSVDTYVSSEGQLVATLGVRDLVVVATRDAVMVADKSRAGEVKNIVAALKAQKRNEASQGTHVFSPWGWQKTLETGPQGTVERRMVQVGARIAPRRTETAESWVVVRGNLRIAKDDDTQDLSMGLSVLIPAGVMLDVTNTGGCEAEIIAVGLL